MSWDVEGSQEFPSAVLCLNCEIGGRLLKAKEGVKEMGK
jgi:hypothetical protein